jgi:hypothetical protein
MTAFCRAKLAFFDNELASMSGRVHDRDCFFKYASLQTALRVIKSKRFRWSSPTNFNDPFDHQTGFTLDIDAPRFAALLTSSAERLIFSDVIPEANPPSRFAGLCLLLRPIKDQFSRQELLAEIHKASIEIAEKLPNHIADLNAVTLQHLCHSRVFCVTEHHDNVVMWSHYADEHRGVAFKLRCIDEIDNALLAARQVTYTDKFIAIPSLDAYAKHLSGERSIDFTSLTWEIAFTKHLDWSYEKEWRVHVSFLKEPAGDGYSIFTENPRVFEAVYLGCRMGQAEIESVVNAVRLHLPDTNIFLAERSRTSFALSFTELKKL